MSRSRKKVSTGRTHNSKIGKLWKRSANKALRIHSRMLIESCTDWDSFIFPVINEVSDVYSSHKDGISLIFDKPKDNQCEIDYGKWHSCHYEVIDSHHKYCNCIGNKNSWYWTGFRK